VKFNSSCRCWLGWFGLPNAFTLARRTVLVAVRLKITGKWRGEREGGSECSFASFLTWNRTRGKKVGIENKFLERGLRHGGLRPLGLIVTLASEERSLYKTLGDAFYLCFVSLHVLIHLRSCYGGWEKKRNLKKVRMM